MDIKKLYENMRKGVSITESVSDVKPAPAQKQTSIQQAINLMYEEQNQAVLESAKDTASTEEHEDSDVTESSSDVATLSNSSHKPKSGEGSTVLVTFPEAIQKQLLEEPDMLKGFKQIVTKYQEVLDVVVYGKDIVVEFYSPNNAETKERILQGANDFIKVCRTNGYLKESARSKAVSRMKSKSIKDSTKASTTDDSIAEATTTSKNDAKFKTNKRVKPKDLKESKKVPKARPRLLEAEEPEEGEATDFSIEDASLIDNNLVLTVEDGNGETISITIQDIDFTKGDQVFVATEEATEAHEADDTENTEADVTESVKK